MPCAGPGSPWVALGRPAPASLAPGGKPCALATQAELPPYRVSVGPARSTLDHRPSQLPYAITHPSPHGPHPAPSSPSGPHTSHLTPPPHPFIHPRTPSPFSRPPSALRLPPTTLRFPLLSTSNISTSSSPTHPSHREWLPSPVCVRAPDTRQRPRRHTRTHQHTTLRRPQSGQPVRFRRPSDQLMFPPFDQQTRISSTLPPHSHHVQLTSIQHPDCCLPPSPRPQSQRSDQSPPPPLRHRFLLSPARRHPI